MSKTLTAFLVALSLFSTCARADETADLPPAPLADETPPSLMTRAVSGAQATLDEALNYLGIRYRRGGSSPETGFDCSGFVRHVYNESLGLLLPHSAKALSQLGEIVSKKSELMPGDLVFFNTMRRTFSHVGIYLGNNLFVHAPKPGAQVRIEDMTQSYWTRRYNGARRVQS